MLKMKIALLTPTFCGYSGIDRVVAQQAARFAGDGHRVTIITMQADMQPAPGVELEVLGLPPGLLLQRIYRLLFPLDIVKNSRYVRLLKGVDLIYSHQYPMNWLACLAKKRYGIKYIYYDYGVAPPESFAGLAERLYMLLFTRLSNLTASQADSAVSISRYLKSELEKHTGLVSEVIYPTIDNHRFHPGLDRSTIRRKHNLENRPVILYLGRISPHKGVHLLIEAFNLVRQKVPDATLIIAGRHTFPDYSNRLKSMADDHIIFTGYVDDGDIPLYYAACDIYATGTLWEGFNLPLAEAQACGRPVVAFDLGPHPEVVCHGKSGFLVKPSDTHAMSHAIIRLIQDEKLRQQMGAAGAEFIREKFA